MVRSPNGSICVLYIIERRDVPAAVVAVGAVVAVVTGG
jgi:hypothetical protein